VQGVEVQNSIQIFNSNENSNLNPSFHIWRWLWSRLFYITPSWW